MLLAGALRADDYKLICEVGDGAINSVNKQVNDLRSHGYEINGNHTQCWVDLGNNCEISICQGMLKKVSKSKPKNIKHEYWVIRLSEGKNFAQNVEDMLNEGWKLGGSVSSSCDASGHNWLVQSLVRDAEVDAKTDTKTAEKKP